MVVTIMDLMQKEIDIIEKLNDVRKAAIREKEKSDLDEASLWIKTNFKEKGLTNDKMRSAYVTQQKQLLYPSFYEHKKSEVNYLENKLKFIRQVIEVMIRFDLKEVDNLEFWEEDKKESVKTETTEEESTDTNKG